MKKTIKLAVVAALALSTTSVFATNGSTLMGLGAKSRAMGGTAIGVAHGAENGLANGALITSVENTEISFGGTIFMPDVTFDNGTGAGAKSSDADMNVIPEISIATKVTDNFYFGIGMWGTAGMGVDYRDEAANFAMVTNLQLMQFGVPLAYKIADFSLAFTPVLQYGALDINYNTGNPDANYAGNGAGVAQDLAFGFNLGAAYEISGVTIGAVYKSQIDMNYDEQLSAAMAGFGVTYANEELSTPAEIGIGASYSMNEHTIAIDYKQIKWEDAEGYKDFAWEDQDVILIGYEYATDGWEARIGYNYAASPITDQGVAGTLLNTFNLLGFPAIVESHVTVGGSYSLSKQTAVDFALAYAPEVTETFTVSNNPNPGTRSIETTHSQTSVTLGLNYTF